MNLNIEVINFGQFKNRMIDRFINKELTMDECSKQLNEQQVISIAMSGLERKQFLLQLCKYKQNQNKLG